MNEYILGIESSCDDTSAAVLQGTCVLSNVIASQKVHEKFGGVVPELASRAHQQNIIPVIDTALNDAKIDKKQLSAVAFTRGPGLLGSLLVGTSFAKAFSQTLNVPMVEVDHMNAHILVHFATDATHTQVPDFPFLCLTVSGGHTQIVVVKDYFDMEVIGKTIDDAAGEAFDKTAKILGLPYPGGPVINKLANEGNPNAFTFAKPVVSGLDYSFSGLKTSILYTVRDNLRVNPNFIEENTADLCASVQKAVIDILMNKLVKAAAQTGIKTVAIAGGVSANTGLHDAMRQAAEKYHWTIFIPRLSYSTDNAAMVAVAGYFKFLRGDFASQDLTPYARQSLNE